MALPQVLILLVARLMLSPAADSYESALAAAVHHFAREGDLEFVRAILEKHPRLVDAVEPFPLGHKPVSTEGYSPLHWAARFGHTAMAEYLIRRGANVNADGGGGWTPLHFAAQRGHLETVKQLVARGANVRAKTSAVPESTGSQPGAPAGPPDRTTTYPAIPARTAIDWAIAEKHPDVVIYLTSLKK
jgi:ankyrin repeat protein